jgi:hypothetical protein
MAAGTVPLCQWAALRGTLSGLQKLPLASLKIERPQVCQCAVSATSARLAHRQARFFQQDSTSSCQSDRVLPVWPQSGPGWRYLLNVAALRASRSTYGGAGCRDSDGTARALSGALRDCTIRLTTGVTTRSSCASVARCRQDAAAAAHRIPTGHGLGRFGCRVRCNCQTPSAQAGPKAEASD